MDRDTPCLPSRIITNCELDSRGETHRVHRVHIVIINLGGLRERFGRDASDSLVVEHTTRAKAGMLTRQSTID